MVVPLPLCAILALGCAPSSCTDEKKDDAPTDLPRTQRHRPSLEETPPLADRELKNVLRRLRSYQKTNFVPPSDEERTSYQEWMENVLRAAWTGRLPEDPAPQGFVGEWIDRGQLWLLREEIEAKRGAGVVVVRPQFKTDLVIEVPHSYFDSWTLPIGRAAFERLGARALLVNTYHRGGQGNAAERMELALSGESEFDVAHQRDSFFLAAHQSLLDLALETLVVQLHGFADESAPPGVDLIVSASDTGHDIHSLAESLEEELEGFGVQRYPDQIDVLGGTTNVQARASRRQHAPFVHLEMSHRLRKSLSEDEPTLERFLAAFSRVRAQ